jgi:hypothetical protein
MTPSIIDCSTRRISLRLVIAVAVCRIAVSAMNADPAAVRPTPKFGKAAENKIYAQVLVNEMKAHNPELLAMGLHAVAPGTKDEKMIACTDDSIGKTDSASDLEVPSLGKTVIVPGALGEAKRYKILTPLKDAHGNTVGLVVFSLIRNENVDMLKALAIGLALSDELSARIETLAGLFRPAE